MLAWKDRLSVVKHMRRRQSGTIETERRGSIIIPLMDHPLEKSQSATITRPFRSSTVSLPAGLGQGDFLGSPDLLLATIEGQIALMNECPEVHDGS